MQLQLNGTAHQNGELVIHVREGNAAWSTSVIRSVDGRYSCMGLQCIYKGQQAFCEHVLFAREQHDTVIAPSEEYRNQEKLKLAQAHEHYCTHQLDQARTLVERLEERLPSKTPTLDLTAPRRIVLEK
jgi:hypothetical protein